ncbi:MAG: FAD-binding protein [Rhodospirillaceae bacterium]|jgi:succinate dehydrogenase/fumarate reductase flavoprotein subunit|nr:FAD-binding protein [Rhodospirillaceae bacterium]
MTIETEWRDYDVVVVGSGGAGSAAAQAASEKGARVLVVSKDPIGCSDTKISEGKVTVRAAGDDDDTEQALSDNLRMGGGSLPDKAITEAFAHDNRAAYDWYRQRGLRPKIDVERSGPKSDSMAMGGHTRRRTVGHASSGVALSHATWNAVVQGARIDYLEDAWFLDVVTESGAGMDRGADEGERRIVGGIVYDASRGKLVIVRASAVVVAAGGLATLFFPKTDTMRGNTGDSYAVMARAGADLIDMEQIQFLPFCLTSPPSYEGLLCGEPSVASFLGDLRDKDGKLIMDCVTLRTRAECAAAIMLAVEDGRGTENGGAYLDLTANAQAPLSGVYFKRYLELAMPSAYKHARQAMGKAAGKLEVPWEVRPAAHYMMGGLRADEHAAAKADTAGAAIAGLFAAGQAMGGVFGANRLGSTALAECTIFGIRSGHSAAAHALANREVADKSKFEPAISAISALFGQRGDLAAAVLKVELQRAAWENIGPVRSIARIERFEAVCENLQAKLANVAIPVYGGWNQAFIEYQELLNMLTVSRAVAAAARERDGSVGGHVRSDGPNISVFAKPYSTQISMQADGQFVSRRIDREGLPFGRLALYLMNDHWRKFKLRMLRRLPERIRDRRIRDHYQAIMQKSGGPQEIEPGSLAGAPAEAMSR